MENATKALLISAGVLFAVVIISLGFATYQGIKSYYGQQQDSLTADQIAAFNLEYEAYNRNDVTGFELVSLINKIINYNNFNAADENLNFRNTDKNFEKMYIEFTITSPDILGGNNNDNNNVKLFNKNKYDSENSRTNTELERIINEMQALENTYGASTLSKLVSEKDNMILYSRDGTKEVKDVIGKFVKVPGYNGTGNSSYSEEGRKTIIKYGQYIEFKRATFRCLETEYNNHTARITKLKFIQN